MVAIANAADMEVLLAVKQAVSEKLCRFILFAQEERLRPIAEEAGLDLSVPELEFRHEAEESAIAQKAVAAVHHQEAQILMKGHIATKDLLKAALSKESGLRKGKVLSHVALFEVPAHDRLIFLTDAAMNISPGLEEKAEIINNAVHVAHRVGMQLPNVALLAPVEVINPAMQSTLDAAVLSQMNRRGQISGAVVDGPYAFDNAVSAEAARQKGLTSEVAGNADILVVPTIEAGNALYKSFMYFANAKVAALISGAKAPIILTSRADSAESKLNSLSLALIASRNF